VATVDEGLALRQQLPAFDQGNRIYLMNGLPPGAERDIAGGDLIPILNSLAEIERWHAFTRATTARPAGLQFDTGLNRLGLGREEALRLIGDPRLLDGLDIALVMSHLACADDPEHPANRTQLGRFRDIADNLKLPSNLKLPGVKSPARTRPLFSLAASSSIFLGADYHFDLVRPGAGLYGINPVMGAGNPLRPALRLQAKILQLREVDLNMTVGYGASHQVRGPSVLATIGVGYADGIFRSLGNRGSVFVAGQRAPIVGRISMDLITVDVGHLPQQMIEIGYYSLPVIGMTAVFTGMVLVLQTYVAGCRTLQRRIHHPLCRGHLIDPRAWARAGRPDAGRAVSVPPWPPRSAPCASPSRSTRLRTLSTNPFKYLVAPRVDRRRADPARAGAASPTSSACSAAIW
jgi:alanine racemase